MTYNARRLRGTVRGNGRGNSGGRGNSDGRGAPTTTLGGGITRPPRGAPARQPGNGRGVQLPDNETTGTTNPAAQAGGNNFNDNAVPNQQNNNANDNAVTAPPHNNTPNAALVPVYTGDLPRIRGDRSLMTEIKPRNTLDLGIVIFTSMFDLHNPALNRPSATVASTHVADMKFSEACIQKLRYFIVLKKLEHHFVTLPIYTYGDRGMEGKTASDRAAHLLVHDCRKYTTEERASALGFENDEDENLYAIMYRSLDTIDNPTLSLQACCRFNYQYCMPYYKSVQIVGKLTDQSAKKLFVRHYEQAFHRMAPRQAGN